jgi:hypothetical protein
MALRDFIGNEDGATTVDLGRHDKRRHGHGIAVAMLVSGGIENLSSDVGTTMSDYEITGEFSQFVAQILAANDFTGRGDRRLDRRHRGRCGRCAGRIADDRARGPRAIDA